jgi:hypothetical protein
MTDFQQQTHAQEQLNAIKQQKWADDCSSSSTSGSSNTTSPQSSLESLPLQDGTLTHFDQLEEVLLKVSATEETTPMHPDYSQAVGLESADNASSASSEELSSTSGDEASDCGDHMSNSNESDDETDESHVEEDLTDSSALSLPIVIEADHNHLHSPTPQRRYRPQVTVPYEPPPLPLYAEPMAMNDPAYNKVRASHPWMFSNAAQNFPGEHSEEFRSSTALSFSQFDAAESEELDGFDGLADSLVNEDELSPLYRRFQVLNHRVLLHLQDEISQMETSLFSKDEAIHNLSEKLKHRKQAKRAQRTTENASSGDCDAKSESQTYRPMSSSMNRLVTQLEMRTELLGRIFVKLGQYSTQFLP